MFENRLRDGAIAELAADPGATLQSQGAPSHCGVAMDPVESLVARTLRDPEVPAQLGKPWVSLLRAMTAMDPGARPSAAAAETQARGLLPRR